MRTGLGLVLVGGLCMALLVWLTRTDIAGFYTPSPAVQAMTTVLLGWLALYHLVDGWL